MKKEEAINNLKDLWNEVYNEDSDGHIYDGEVTHYYWCRLHDRPIDDTDYCAWGEERNEA